MQPRPRTRLITESVRSPLTETVPGDRAMRRIANSRHCRTRVQLAVSRNALQRRSFRAEDYPKSKGGFIGVAARRKLRLTTDPRMASANMAGDRGDAHNGLQSRNR